MKDIETECWSSKSCDFPWALYHLWSGDAILWHLWPLSGPCHGCFCFSSPKGDVFFLWECVEGTKAAFLRWSVRPAAISCPCTRAICDMLELWCVPLVLSFPPHLQDKLTTFSSVFLFIMVLVCASEGCEILRYVHLKLCYETHWFIFSSCTHFFHATHCCLSLRPSFCNAMLCCCRLPILLLPSHCALPITPSPSPFLPTLTFHCTLALTFLLRPYPCPCLPIAPSPSPSLPTLALHRTRTLHRTLALHCTLALTFLLCPRPPLPPSPSLSYCALALSCDPFCLPLNFTIITVT